MSATEKPVWVWLPGQAQPVLCGLFRLENEVGTFHYEEAYRKRNDALALDPFSLPFTRSKRGARETRQHGLFGVFRDASPEGFGLALLEQVRGQNLTDPLARLEFSEGDAVGAIEVCEGIQAKLSFKAPSSHDLLQVLEQLPAEKPSSYAAREVKGVHGTSLGGERPKLTVTHNGQLWIAKLQDRGDGPHMPLREFVAMRLARRCDIDAAEVEFLLTGEREVLLVRRFDRHVDDAGNTFRSLYASAHTVLRLDAQVRGDRQRSYVALAHEVRRRCAAQDAPARAMQRELWRRMAFNALIGNGDDHPRNHGLVHRDGRWQLSPAFDIAPYTTYSGAQAMAVNRDGKLSARTRFLVQDCDNFGYEREEALAWLEASKRVITQGWREEMAAAGFDPAALEAPTFEWLERGDG